MYSGAWECTVAGIWNNEPGALSPLLSEYRFTFIHTTMKFRMNFYLAQEDVANFRPHTIPSRWKNENNDLAGT